MYNIKLIQSEINAFYLSNPFIGISLKITFKNNTLLLNFIIKFLAFYLNSIVLLPILFLISPHLIYVRYQVYKDSNFFLLVIFYQVKCPIFLIFLISKLLKVFKENIFLFCYLNIHLIYFFYNFIN